MLMRTDPFRELDRLTQEAFGAAGRGPAMPMDAYRQGDEFVIQMDLPGVDPGSIDLTVEKNVLTVTAKREWKRPEGDQVVVSERPQGTFSRQIFVSEALDLDRVEASYERGVLTLEIPVAERAKPRRIEISRSDSESQTIEGTATRSE